MTAATRHYLCRFGLEEDNDEVRRNESTLKKPTTKSDVKKKATTTTTTTATNIYDEAMRTTAKTEANDSRNEALSLSIRP